MSYDVESDNILTGSLNLMAPGDATPPGDALCLKNWRVDQSGALRSRLADADDGYAWPAGPIRTLFEFKGHSYIASTSLFRDSVNIATGFDGRRIGMASMNGFLWCMNQGLEGRDDGTTWRVWSVAPPSTMPTLIPVIGGALVVGMHYYYYVTWVDSSGEETNPSPGAGDVGLGNVIHAPNQLVQVWRPTTTDPDVTHWNVYRLGNTLDTAYLLNSTPIPYATDHFVDTGDVADQLDDTSVTEFGIAMKTNVDSPPECAGMLGPYYDRLIAWNSAAHPNWLWWSEQLEPQAWPGSFRDDGNHTPVGDDDEEIVWCAMHSRQLRVYKARSIWRMAGDPDDATSVLEPTNRDIGLIGMGALASRGDLDYFQAMEGIYESNGYTTRKISAKLDPLFKGDPVNVQGADPSTPLNQDMTARAKNVLAVINGRLYFSYCSGVATEPNATLVCDLDTERWYSDDRAFCGLYYAGQGSPLRAGANGHSYLLEQQQADVAPAITLQYQTSFRHQGHPDRQKTYADVVIEYSQSLSAAPWTLAVFATTDNQATAAGLGGIPVGDPGATWYPQRLRKVFPLGGVDAPGIMGRNIAIILVGLSQVPASIYSIEIHYRLHPRDALAFDSGEMVLGHQGAKEMDLLQLQIACSANVVWSLLTDLPGGTMTARATGTVGTTGDQQQLLEFPLVVEGRLVRLRLSAVVPFRLYGVRIRSRHLGVFLDGAAGETFTTLPQRVE